VAISKRMSGQYTSRENSDGTRVCSFCGESKPLEEFAKNGLDGEGTTRYRDDCKQCYNIRRRENRTSKRHNDFIGGQKRRGEEDPDFSFQDWKLCVIYFGGECAYCGRTMRRGERLTHDHLEALSKGGRTTSDNIIPACSTCNSSKGNDDFKDWFMKQAFFSQERINKIFKWRTMMRQLGGYLNDD